MCSLGTIAALCLILSTVMFPNLVRSTLASEYSIDIYNAASSQKTLGIMLTVVLLALPLVLAYSTWVYLVFRGKVKIDEFSY